MSSRAATFTALFAATALTPVAWAGDTCQPSPFTGPGGNYEAPTQQISTLGEGLRLRIVVLSYPDCKPVSGALVESWQAGRDGQYANRLRTAQRTNARGEVTLNTEWPNFQPPHIHFHVAFKGYERLLTTWYPPQPVEQAELKLVLKPQAR